MSFCRPHAPYCLRGSARLGRVRHPPLCSSPLPLQPPPPFTCNPSSPWADLPLQDNEEDQPLLSSSALRACGPACVLPSGRSPRLTVARPMGDGGLAAHMVLWSRP